LEHGTHIEKKEKRVVEKGKWLERREGTCRCSNSKGEGERERECFQKPTSINQIRTFETKRDLQSEYWV